MCDNQPICFTEKEVVARKEHSCCECSCKIEKGDKYILTKGIWKDGPASFKTCAACYRTYGLLEDPHDFGDLFTSLSGEFPHLAKEYLEFYKRASSEENYLNRIQELKDKGYRIKGNIPCLDWRGDLILETRADVSYGDKVLSLVDIYDADIIRGEVLSVVGENWDIKKEDKYIKVVDCDGKIENIPAHHVKKCGNCEDCSHYGEGKFSFCRKLKTIKYDSWGTSEFSCSKWEIDKAWVESELKKFDKKREEFRAHGLYY